MDIIQEKVNEIALANALIIEKECKKACEKFGCAPNDLIIEYRGQTEIKITVKASHFTITNNFYLEDGVLKT